MVRCMRVTHAARTRSCDIRRRKKSAVFDLTLGAPAGAKVGDAMRSLMIKLEHAIHRILERYCMQSVIATHPAFRKETGGSSETYILPTEAVKEILKILSELLGEGLYDIAPDLPTWQENKGTKQTLSAMDLFVTEKLRPLAAYINTLTATTALPAHAWMRMHFWMHEFQGKYGLSEIPVSLQRFMLDVRWANLLDKPWHDIIAEAELLFLMHTNGAGILVTKPHHEKDEKTRKAEFAAEFLTVLRDTGFDLQAPTDDPKRVFSLLKTAAAFYEYEVEHGFYKKPIVNELAEDGVASNMPTGAALDFGIRIANAVGSLFSKSSPEDAFRSRLNDMVVTELGRQPAPSRRRAPNAATALYDASAQCSKPPRSSLGAYLPSPLNPSLAARASYGSTAPMPRVSNAAQLQYMLANLRVSAGAPTPSRAPRCSGGAPQPRASAGAAVKSVLGPSYMLC